MKYNLVGLTGTTGAGKSQVRKYFEDNGYVSIDADFLAREVMKNKVVLCAVQNAFGDDVVCDSKLDRKLLAERAFLNKDTAKMLNSIVHPFIGALFVEQLEGYVNKGHNKIVFDAPQLFESKLNVLCHCIVAVVAEDDVRIKRIIQRDNITLQQAQKRIAVQYDTEFFKKNCDFVIENNSDLDHLKKQTQLIINSIKRGALWLNM